MQTTASMKHLHRDRRLVVVMALGIVTFAAIAIVSVLLMRDDTASRRVLAPAFANPHDMANTWFIEENRYLPGETGSFQASPSLPVDHLFLEQNLYLPDGGAASATDTIGDQFFLDQNLHLPTGRPAMVPPFGEGSDY